VADELRRIKRAANVSAVATMALLLLAAPGLAEERIKAYGEEPDQPVNAVASTGGVATAEGSSSVQTGDIVTGYNTGHSVDTGGTSNGDLIVTVAEMSSAADLEVVAEVGPQIADASGGDEGYVTTEPPDRPEFHVDIDNTDKNTNKNNATGVGEGGQGGTGGSGGTINIPATP
jgi:hypothetical protein